MTHILICFLALQRYGNFLLHAIRKNYDFAPQSPFYRYLIMMKLHTFEQNAQRPMFNVQ